MIDLAGDAVIRSVEDTESEGWRMFLLDLEPEAWEHRSPTKNITKRRSREDVVELKRVLEELDSRDKKRLKNTKSQPKMKEKKLANKQLELNA